MHGDIASFACFAYFALIVYNLYLISGVGLPMLPGLISISFRTPTNRVLPFGRIRLSL